MGGLRFYNSYEGVCPSAYPCLPVQPRFFPLREYHVPTTCIPFQVLYALISIPRHDRLVRSPCFLLARFDTFCFPRSAHPLVLFTSLGSLLLLPSLAFHRPTITSRMKICDPEALFLDTSCFLFSFVILFLLLQGSILKAKIIHFTFRLVCYRSTTKFVFTDLYGDYGIRLIGFKEKTIQISKCRFILSKNIDI